MGIQELAAMTERIELLGLRELSSYQLNGILPRTVKFVNGIK